MKCRYAFLITFFVGLFSFHSTALAVNAPSNLSASSVSSSQINLGWTYNSTDEAGFEIKQAASSGGPFSRIATLRANVKTYWRTGLSASTTYYYADV